MYDGEEADGGDQYDKRGTPTTPKQVAICANGL